MSITIKKIFALFFFTVLFVAVPANAALLPIGAECTSNSQCRSGDCESSTKKDAQGNALSYCDCSELSLSDSASCANEYGGNDSDWSCKDGIDKTFDLDYCLKVNNTSKITDENVKPPLPFEGTTQPGFFDFLTDTEAAILSSDIQKMVDSPQPRIRIPGVSFTAKEDLKQIEDDGNTYLSIPFLGEYISSVYQYAIVVIGILAVIMIIIAGFQWVMSAGNSDGIASAKNRITGAVIGLIIALGSYTLLFTINPELVQFRNLRVLYVKGVPFEATYAEGEPPATPGTPGYLGGNPMSSPNDKCLIDNFAPGKKIGEKPELVKIPMYLNVADITVNKYSADAWKKVSDEVVASTDPEIVGYLQYMRDFKAKKVPDLMGSMDGAGVVSFNFGKGIGISRHNGEPLKSLSHDMHVLGLAVDFMTRSNWDINWGGTTKGASAKQYCTSYQKTLEKMKQGTYGPELAKDPYRMFARLEKNISDCLDPNAFAANPFTSFPQGMIDIFKKHGFYWGGYGWGNKRRSDAMHFQYAGPCEKK